MTVHQGYNAILPDLMLPRLDGMTLCRKLRRDFQIATPIIMLTARNPADDPVVGFAPGADNYSAHPFSLKELDARNQALVCRAQGLDQHGVYALQRLARTVVKAGFVDCAAHRPASRLANAAR